MLEESVFNAAWTTSYQSVIDNVYDITRGDGQKVIKSIMIAYELMLNSRTDDGQHGRDEEKWYMGTHWTPFVSYCQSKGLQPQTEFAIDAYESRAFDNGYQDPDYPSILNGRQSVRHLYKSLKWFKDNNMYIPQPYLLSCNATGTPAPGLTVGPLTSHTYSQMMERIFNDADAVVPTLGTPFRKWYELSQTLYVADTSMNQAFGPALGAQGNMSHNNRICAFCVWTTPWTITIGGTTQYDAAYPYDLSPYLP